MMAVSDWSNKHKSSSSPAPTASFDISIFDSQNDDEVLILYTLF